MEERRKKIGTGRKIHLLELQQVESAARNTMEESRKKIGTGRKIHLLELQQVEQVESAARNPMEERRKKIGMGRKIHQGPGEETSSTMPDAEAVQEEKIIKGWPPLLAVSFVRKATNADSSVSIGELCNRIYNGVFMNPYKLKFWVDRKLEKNCFLLLAKELSITWIDDEKYWGWIDQKENCYSGEADVPAAELRDVCWLNISGTFKTIMLSPKTTYEVSFMVKISENGEGWHAPMNLSLTLPDGTTQGRIENMKDKPREEWIRIPVGAFMTTQKNVGRMSFSLSETGNHWKSGLIVKGVFLLPEDRSKSLSMQHHSELGKN